jgi:hypothetical protein
VTDHRKLEVLVQQLITLETWRLEILPLLLTMPTIQVGELNILQLITLGSWRLECFSPGKSVRYI